MKTSIRALSLFAAFFVLCSFCGMYVSSADGTVKNKTSQVIMVRDGNRNAITMYNDFQGDPKDFAMVVPVPVVLRKSDIKVVPADVFKHLNDYSAPRLVEYYDENPCENRYEDRAMEKNLSGAVPGMSVRRSAANVESKVKIEAQYIVGEYDILILSSKESAGLRDWLKENGYKLPEGAGEVLEPYIKSNMKFFVAKVNEAERKKLGNGFLRPIQISFPSPKFMLPIRLGMANGDGDQDLVVYAFTKGGRVECTNYRNAEIPTGQDIPLFVKQNFGAFYSNLFSHQWQEEDKAVSFLEYAWDVSPSNFQKCDPCSSEPPNNQDLVNSGIWWLNGPHYSDYSDVEGEEYAETDSRIFFTRLHFRYNRRSFPQDLQFQTTPNKTNFQARYVLRHPAKGPFQCEEGKVYVKSLKARRKVELQTLQNLTGKDLNTWQNTEVASADEDVEPDASYAKLIGEMPSEDKDHDRHLPFALGAAAIVGAGLWLRKKGTV